MITMKVLSVRQPWAFLLVSGIKNVENRNWHTDYTGTLLIHASKSWDHKGYVIIQKLFPDAAEVIEKHFRPIYGWGCKSCPVGAHADEFGAIVGQVKLTGCGSRYRPAGSKWEETGLWHWRVSNARKFETPIPTQGKLGLWNFTLEEDVK